MNGSIRNFELTHNASREGMQQSIHDESSPKGATMKQISSTPLLTPLKLPLSVVETSKNERVKGYKHYQNVFHNENVKGLLKDLKLSLRDA